MSEGLRNVELGELIAFALERQSKALRVGMPGRIEKFYKETQTADIKPLLFETDEAEDGSEVNTPIKIITRVPVQFPSAGGFILTFPVTAGDMCWLQFSDRALEQWFKKGTDVDPIDLRRHDFNDAICILGIQPDPKKLTEFDESRAVFGKQGGKRIAISGTEVHIGVDHNELAAAFAARADRTDDRLNKLQQKLDSHTHKLSLVAGTTDPAVNGKPSLITPGSLHGDTDAISPGLGSLDSVASDHVKLT